MKQRLLAASLTALLCATVALICAVAAILRFYRGLSTGLILGDFGVVASIALLAMVGLFVAICGLVAIWRLTRPRGNT